MHSVCSVPPRFVFPVPSASSAFIPSCGGDGDNGDVPPRRHGGHGGILSIIALRVLRASAVGIPRALRLLHFFIPSCGGDGDNGDVRHGDTEDTEEFSLLLLSVCSVPPRFVFPVPSASSAFLGIRRTARG